MRRGQHRAQVPRRGWLGAVDHYLAMDDRDGLPGPTDAWVTLAGLARETSTIRLGTLVTSATFRRPGPTAISVAQVDAMSDGRVEFGLGAGWFAAEHEAYGIPFPSVGERFDLLEDSLAVMTGLWRTPPGELFSYDGASVTVSDSPALPKPVQQDPFSGGPPVIIGGKGRRRTPALAARYAAEFNVNFVPVHEAGPLFERVATACAQIGRDPATLVRSAALACVVGRDKADFRRRAAAIGREPEIIGFVVFGVVSWLGPNRNEGFDITYDPSAALGYMSVLGLLLGALLGAVVAALFTYRK